MGIEGLLTKIALIAEIIIAHKVIYNRLHILNPVYIMVDANIKHSA